MPAATITATSLPAPFTAAGLLAFLKVQLPAVLGSLHDEYSDANNDFLVFARVQSAAALGTVYVRVQLPKVLGTATIDMLQTWSTTTRTGTSLGMSQFVNPAPNGVNTQLDLRLVVHDELRVAYFQQGSTVDGFGLLRPASRPIWWDENTHPYVFLHRVATHNPVAPSAARNPTGISLTPQWLDYRLQVSNPATSRRELVSGISLLAGTGASGLGIIGTFGADVCSVAATGLALFDTLEVTAGSEEYLLLSTATPYIAIRSV